MNSVKVKALEHLLQQAMDSAVIRDRHQGPSISKEEYSRLLASHRRSVDPNQRFLAARFQPEISDDRVRQCLLDVIRTTLGQYIHNDRLQSAVIVTGGLKDGFKISDLTNHLITIAFSRGAEHAARSFYKCAESSFVNMQFITLLDGMKIEHDIEISEGMRLVPIPNDVDNFPPYVITPAFGHYTDYYGRTLIILDERVSPIFAHPSEMSIRSGRGPFIRTDVNTAYPNFTVRDFCEALSLSANHIVNYVVWWTHFDPDEAYAVQTSGQLPANSFSFHSKNTALEVNGEDIQRALSLYSARKDLSSIVSHKLRVPIDRWMRSKMDKNPVDVFINLGTALESLYLNDIQYAGELRFRMALRAAWHLGNNSNERLLLIDDFKDIYDLRSQAVHTGNLNQKNWTPEFMAKAQDLCLKSIVKIIEDGRFPNWNQLVVGG